MHAGSGKQLDVDTSDPVVHFQGADFDLYNYFRSRESHHVPSSSGGTCEQNVFFLKSLSCFFFTKTIKLRLICRIKTRVRHPYLKLQFRPTRCLIVPLVLNLANSKKKELTAAQEKKYVIHEFHEYVVLTRISFQGISLSVVLGAFT